jgi:hypothetical protein
MLSADLYMDGSNFADKIEELRSKMDELQLQLADNPKRVSKNLLIEMFI